MKEIYLNWKKENKAIKDRIIWYIRKGLKHGKEDYIEYDSNGDWNKTLSVEAYLNQIRPNLKDELNDIKKSDTLKI